MSKLRSFLHVVVAIGVAALSLAAVGESVDFREYLEVGGYCITTTIKPNATTAIEIDVETSDTAHDKILFCERNCGFDFLCWLGKKSGEMVAPGYGSLNNFGDKDTGVSPGGRMLVQLASWGVFVNGRGVVDSETMKGKDNGKTTTEILRILGMNSDLRTFYGKFYGCRLWHGGALALDLIPCVNPSGTPCVYDAVSENYIELTLRQDDDAKKLVASAAKRTSVVGAWTYGAALDDSSVNWLDKAKWQGARVPMALGDTASLDNSTASSADVLQRINLPFYSGLSWNSAQVVSLALDSVSGAKNQQLRQQGSMKTLTAVVDPSGMLGPWRTELVYSGLRVLSEQDAVIPQVVAENEFSLDLPNAGVTTKVGKLRGRGTLVKSGAGDLEIVDGGADAVRLRLTGSGTVKVGRNKSADNAPAAGSVLHFDASQTNTMVFVEEGGKRYVSEWKDCEGTAVAKKGTTSPTTQNNLPFLVENALNGLPVVDFGAFYGSGLSYTPSYEPETFGEAAWLELDKTYTNVKEAFVLMQEARGYDCEPVALGHHSATPWYRNAANKNAALRAGVPFGDNYAYFGVYRDGVSLNGRNVSHDRQSNLDRWTVWNVPLLATGSSGPRRLMNDRGQRIGGAKVAEILVYNKELTEAERQQTLAYLKNKWLKGMGTETDDVDLGTVSVESSGVTIDVGAGRSAKVDEITSRSAAEIVKTGPGELAVSKVTAANGAVDVDVQAGTLTIDPVVATDDTAPAENPMVWLSADADISRFEIEASGGKDYIKCWKDVRVGQETEYAYNDGTNIGKQPFSRPWLDKTNTLNGKPIVNFGDFLDTVDGSGKANGAALRFVNGAISPREAFIVFKDNGTSQSAWVFGSSSYSFCRSTQSSRKRLVAEEYAPAYVCDGRWSVDGVLVNPMDFDLPQGEFSVIDLALEKGAKAEFLGTDRPSSFKRGGGLCIAEIIYYDRELTDSERRNTQAYLLKKWKNKGHPVDVCKLGAVNGTGTLKVARDVKATFGVADLDDLIASADLRLDASLEDTMVFDPNDASRVLVWNDANGRDLCAKVASTANNAPKLIQETIAAQEKNAVSLFGMNQSSSKGSKGNPAAASGQGTAFELYQKSADVRVTPSYRDYFVVMSDCTTGCGSGMEHRALLVDCSYTTDYSYYFYRDSKGTGAILRPDGYASANAYDCTYWLDGVQSAPKTTCITDINYHVYAIKGVEDRPVNAIGMWMDGGMYYYYGGKNICELLYFSRALTDSERAAIQKHLEEKWQAKSVEFPVSSAAKIELAGGCLRTGAEKTVSVAGLSGSGSISAKAVESPASLEFTFKSRTECDQLTVDGEFRIGASGMVTILSDGAKPKAGEYPIISAKQLVAEQNVTNWTVVNGTGYKGTCTLFVRGNAIYVRFSPPGLAIVIR